MEKDNDISIFYDQADNSRLTEDGAGWVDRFKLFLTMMLRQITGKEPRISGLPEDQVPSAENLSDIKILILIISPHSVKSGKITKVLDNFYASRKKNKDNQVSHVFKVLKFPVSNTDQPENLRSLLAYDMYNYNPATGQSQEIDNFFSPEAETDFWMKMVDLAYDINELLLRYNGSPEEYDNDGHRIGVFLAETDPELVVQRNMIRRELQRIGYSVYPKKNLSPDPDGVKEELNELLPHCFATIHLLSDRVELKEDGSSGTSVTAQNDHVSTYIKTTGEEILKNFSRLIWLSPNFKVSEEKQHRFIEKLRRDVEESGRTEIFQTPFEDFKFIVRRTLSEFPERVSDIKTEEATGSGNKKIYVIYDKEDKNNVQPLLDLMNKKGYKVLLPSFEGNLMDIRQLHIQNLVDFDGVIIFRDHVNEFWVRMKLLDILKSPGFGRLKSLDNKAILSAGARKLNKEHFRNYEVDLIETSNVDEKIIEPFLSKIQ